MVRIAAMAKRPSRAMGFGIRFVADRKDRGTEITAPTMVPRNAMHSVSSRRYATPEAVKLNSSFVSGCRMPERMFPATLRPFPAVSLITTVELDHASRHAAAKASSNFMIQVFGARS